MTENITYNFMSRKELAVAAGDIDVRTLYNYILDSWDVLKSLGCTKRKKLTPAGVKYLCENYGISLQ